MKKDVEMKAEEFKNLGKIQKKVWISFEEVRKWWLSTKIKMARWI